MSASPDPGTVGRGLLVAGAAATGTLKVVASVEDVLDLMSSPDLADTVVFCEQASVTNLAPIVAKVAGVISTAGGPTSHLAIVARGFQATCVVSAELSADPAALAGRRVEIGADGTIALLEGSPG